MEKGLSGYEVGALLYSPAVQRHAVDTLIGNKIPAPFSFAFCLEDTIRDDYVDTAEKMLKSTLEQILTARQSSEFYMPRIFIRVRSPEQLARLAKEYRSVSSILTGFILPKFFIANSAQYIAAVQQINCAADKRYWVMPIFESADMIPLHTRYESLYAVKEQMQAIAGSILNVRVGGNDLCHAFGVRRNCSQSIYDVNPVSNLLTDLITVFGGDYVISGPVWEYYDGPGWEAGLRRETRLDLLNGFIGKTVIHPKQVPVVTQELQVSRGDYEDARMIADQMPGEEKLVAGSTARSRMNEYNTHSRWAARILALAKAFGVREQGAV